MVCQPNSEGFYSRVIAIPRHKELIDSGTISDLDRYIIGGIPNTPIPTGLNFAQMLAVFFFRGWTFGLFFFPGHIKNSQKYTLSETNSKSIEN